MMNPMAAHPCIWVPEWSTAYGPYAVQQAAALGYASVVVPLRDPSKIDTTAITKLFEGTGVTPINTASTPPAAHLATTDPDIREAGMAHLRRAIRLARDMGSNHLGGVLYSPLRKAEHPLTEDERKSCADALAVLGEEASQQGIRLVLEVVNRYETNVMNTAAQAVELIEMSGSDNLFIHLDTFHMNIEEDDPLAAVRTALPWLKYFEIGQSHRGTLRQGGVQISKQLDEVVRLGYSGMIGVEAFSRALLTPATADALAIWRDTFVAHNGIAADAMSYVRQAHDRKTGGHGEHR